MLRRIALPEGLNAELYCSPMPGRWDWPMRQAASEILDAEVDLVICLSPMREIREFASAYARAIDDEALPWDTWRLPIPDGGLPQDEDDFLEMVQDAAEELRGGVNTVIHCFAGIGRSGTFAMALLVALGLSLEDARIAVENAGAGPETYEQEHLVERLASSLQQDSEN